MWTSTQVLKIGTLSVQKDSPRNQVEITTCPYTLAFIGSLALNAVKDLMKRTFTTNTVTNIDELSQVFSFKICKGALYFDWLEDWKLLSVRIVKYLPCVLIFLNLIRTNKIFYFLHYFANITTHVICLLTSSSSLWKPQHKFSNILGGTLISGPKSSKKWTF